MAFKTLLLRLLGFRSMVLIPGEGYADFSPEELAEMIEAHLGGVARFDRDALYEFQCMEYQGLVEDVRKDLACRLRQGLFSA